MSYLSIQIEMLKKAIEKGIVEKDNPILREQKEGIIEQQYLICQAFGINKSKTQIDAEINKTFADELGFEV